MSEDKVPPISLILDRWKSKCGELRRSEQGYEYVIIPSSRMRTSLHQLVKTLMKLGYTFDQLDSPSLATKIADVCWRQDKIKKMSASQIREIKLSLIKDWNEVLAEYVDIVIEDYVETRTVVDPKEVNEGPTKEELLEEIWNPKNRLKSEEKIDRSKDTNWNLLKKLGIEGDDWE